MIQRHSQKNRIRVTFADFADLASVARAAQDVLEQVSQIDVLVNNSGIFYSIEDVLQFQLSSQQNHDFVVSDQLVKSLFVDRTSSSICFHGSDCFHYIKVLMVCQRDGLMTRILRKVMFLGTSPDRDI